MAANACKYLDGHEVQQGGLGSYVIAASVAQYKEKVEVAPTEADYDPFGGDGEAMDGMEEPQQPAVVLSNMFEVTPRLGGFYIDLRNSVGGQCAKHGPVEDVVVDQDKGTITVTFPWGEAGENGAKAVAAVMDGRWFDERSIKAVTVGITVTAPAPAPAPAPQVDPLQGADLSTFSVKQLKGALTERGTTFGCFKYTLTPQQSLFNLICRDSIFHQITHPHAHAHTLTQAQTQTHIPAHKHTNTQIHTHTHTH